MCLTPVQSQEIFILTCIICFSENGELLWKKVDIGMLRWLDWIWTNSIWERFRSILKWSLKRHKNSKIACYPQLANFLKKMISFRNAASSHSGLTPLKTAYKKRGELLWALASKKNFNNLHSAAFVTVFARNWSTPTNFAFFKKPLDKFLYKFDNPEIICQLISISMAT